MKNETTTKKTEITFLLHFEFMKDFNAKITVKYMDREDRVLSFDVLDTDALPEELDVPAGTDYVIVEREVENDGGETEIVREFKTKDEPYFFVLTPGENGFGVVHPITLNWDGEQTAE